MDATNDLAEVFHDLSVYDAENRCKIVIEIPKSHAPPIYVYFKNGVLSEVSVDGIKKPLKNRLQLKSIVRTTINKYILDLEQKYYKQLINNRLLEEQLSSMRKSRDDENKPGKISTVFVNCLFIAVIAYVLAVMFIR